MKEHGNGVSLTTTPQVVLLFYLLYILSFPESYLLKGFCCYK